MEVDILKQLLGIQGNEKDVLIQFTLDDVEEIIKNHCHVKELPNGLERTAYRMAIDLYQYGNAGGEEAPLTVSSVSVGGTSTSFSNATDAIKDTLLADYKDQLNRYRKLVW